MKIALYPYVQNCINVIRRFRVAISIVSVLLLVPAISYSTISTHNSSGDVIASPVESHSLSFVLSTDALVDQEHILAAVPVPAVLPLFISSILSGLVAINSEAAVKYNWFILSNQVGNRGQAAYLYVY